MDTTTVTSLVTPTGALELQNSGQAVIIDVRDGDDYAKEHVAGGSVFRRFSITCQRRVTRSSSSLQKFSKNCSVALG